jgi:hypothetical protein
MAGHDYLIDADRTTAQSPWRQPFFFLYPTIPGKRSHFQFDHLLRKPLVNDL